MLAEAFVEERERLQIPLLWVETQHQSEEDNGDTNERNIRPDRSRRARFVLNY